MTPRYSYSPAHFSGYDVDFNRLVRVRRLPIFGSIMTRSILAIRDVGVVVDDNVVPALASTRSARWQW